MFDTPQTVERWATLVIRADQVVEVLALHHTEREARIDCDHCRKLYLGVTLLPARCVITLPSEVCTP